MNVLIICQRKSSDSETAYVNNTVNTIKKHVGDINNTYKYFYITDCCRGGIISKNPDCSDIISKLEPNKIIYDWLQNNINNFDIVVLNTCPLSFFDISIFYQLWNTLKNTGKIYFIAANNLVLTHSNTLTIETGILKLKQQEFINKLFIPEEGKSFYIKKNIDASVYSSLINNYCIILNNKDTSNYPFFFFLPIETQKLFLKICRYGKHKNKGDTGLIDIILNLTI